MFKRKNRNSLLGSQDIVHERLQSFLQGELFKLALLKMEKSGKDAGILEGRNVFMSLIRIPDLGSFVPFAEEVAGTDKLFILELLFGEVPDDDAVPSQFIDSWMIYHSGIGTISESLLPFVGCKVNCFTFQDVNKLTFSQFYNDVWEFICHFEPNRFVPVDSETFFEA